MQIFMRSIVFSANEDDIKVALAQRLHRPPFSIDSESPINFHVDLFRAARSRGATHRGMGILTVPATQIGEDFLAIYGSGVVVKSRRILFSRSTRPVNEGLVEFVRTTPWMDPKRLREEKETRARLSGPINLSRFSFGRFCRDGVFSVEASYLGTVACNIESRRIEITHNGNAASELGSRQNLETPGSNFLDFSALQSLIDSDFEDIILDTFSLSSSVSYAANRIIAVAAQGSSSASEHQLFLQSDLPPTFERRMTGPFEVDDREPIPERASSFGDKDFVITSRASQGLRLVFRSHQDLNTFLDRCNALHLPKASTRDITIDERNIYSEAKLTDLQDFLSSLDFGLAFEVEKAVWGGILEPEEVISMRDSLVELQQKTQDFETAAIFRYFLTTLSVPGLESTPKSKKHKRRTKKQQVVASPLVHLRGKLAEAIAAYIADLYRPKHRYTPSTAICQSYHLILTPSTQILEGPLPDQSNSVLRRFHSHECFLRVSFQDENRSPPRRDPNLSINQLLENRYKKPLNLGLRVGGRPYEFLGYSMSGLKEYSFIFVTPFLFEGVMLNASGIRDRLGDFSKILHQPSLLGARWSQAFSASDPSVTLDADQIQLADDKVSTTGSLFTDGCSSISVLLSREVWKRLRASQRIQRPPSAFHFRCGGAKGVLVQNPDLPGKTLLFRPSQTKFVATDIRTLDIAATSARPIPMYLNRPLIALLEHHGAAPEVFMALQNSTIDEIQSLKNSLLQASKIFSQYGLGASFRLPSLFNNLFYLLKLEIGDWSDPQVFQHQLIKTALAYATTHILREIKHRAHIPVPGSYTLIGVSDEWDCLDDGEIYATVVDDRTGLNLTITGRVLITRSPQIHPGDVQFVTAVRKPQLEHLHNVVVFSCKGSRSLPSKLGGGDLDGDIYNLILDEKLFPPKDFTAVPGEYVTRLPKTTLSPCTVSDIADFVIDFIKSDLLGYICILHLRIADFNITEGPGCADCLQLAQHASHAVDFSKRGVPVDIRDLPKPPNNLRPDFLSGEGVNPALSMGDRYYPSVKILGRLYRNVPIDDYHPDPSELEQQRTDAAKIRIGLASIGLRSLGLPSISIVPNEDLLEEMRHILDEYADQLMTIAKTHMISKRANAYLSEAELISGTIQERYDHRKRREAVSAMNLQTGELAKAIRYEFRSPAYRETQGTAADDEEEEYDDDDDEGMAGDEERRRDKFERAWAAWLVAEEALDDDPSSYGPSSFGLLALGTILEVVKEARNSM
ncbi:RNA dependent RNA polymerase-domain-containing protein [Mycena epipterygia]|nr:RNA dependent RNA polymerase-domain-containing protein [Mycena epipterygia]